VILLVGMNDRCGVGRALVLCVAAKAVGYGRSIFPIKSLRAQALLYLVSMDP
jgi:hypothetical protein